MNMKQPSLIGILYCMFSSYKNMVFVWFKDEYFDESWSSVKIQRKLVL